MNIKSLSISLATILALSFLGTLILYQMVGATSGRASLCFAGSLSGAAVGYYRGFYYGQRFMTEITLIAAGLSLPIIPLFYVLKDDHADMVSGLAPCSIGLAVLLGFNIACIVRKKRQISSI